MMSQLCSLYDKDKMNECEHPQLRKNTITHGTIRDGQGNSTSHPDAMTNLSIFYIWSHSSTSNFIFCFISQSSMSNFMQTFFYSVFYVLDHTFLSQHWTPKRFSVHETSWILSPSTWLANILLLVNAIGKADTNV